jgi:hypothetical protein
VGNKKNIIHRLTQMDTDKSEILNSLFNRDLDEINQITEKIIGCSYTVSTT